jgi:broad specificity phosphatase PhoE
MHLFLIRHGQSHVNLNDWNGGAIDTGLTPLGQLQSERLARWIAQHMRADVLYTSTMARALETSAYLANALHLEIRPDDRLREVGNCYADGTPVPADAMPIHFVEFRGSEDHMRISQRGESWLLFRQRVASFVGDVLARHGSDDPESNVLAVCHGAVISAAADAFFDVGAQCQAVPVMMHNTGITHWEHRPEPDRRPWRLHAINAAYHLIEENGVWLGSWPILPAASWKSDSGDSDA